MHDVGWARDQATSRGSWGEYSAISRMTNETKQRPNHHYVECCPQPFRHHMEQVRLIRSRPTRLLLHVVRLDDGMQKNMCPNPPNRGTRPQKGRWHTSQVEREMSAKQAARQHRAEPRGILAIFGKMHDARCGMGSTRESWGEYSTISRMTN